MQNVNVYTRQLQQGFVALLFSFSFNIHLFCYSIIFVFHIFSFCTVTLLVENPDVCSRRYQGKPSFLLAGHFKQVFITFRSEFLYILRFSNEIAKRY